MRQGASECLSSIRLEPEHEAELRMGFDLLDRDKSGRISLSNLAVLYLKKKIHVMDTMWIEILEREKPGRVA